MKVASLKFTKVSELRTLLELLLNTTVTDEELIWAVNLHHAEYLLNNMNRSDFAQMLQEGIVAKKTIQGVMEYIATYIDYEHDVNEHQEHSYSEFIVFSINHAFGNRPLAVELIQLNPKLFDIDAMEEF